MNDENSWVIGGESTGGRWNKQCNYPTAIGPLRGQDFGSGEFKSLLLSVDRSGLKEFRSAGFLFGTIKPGDQGISVFISCIHNTANLHHERAGKFCFCVF